MCVWDKILLRMDELRITMDSSEKWMHPKRKEKGDTKNSTKGHLYLLSFLIWPTRSLPRSPSSSLLSLAAHRSCHWTHSHTSQCQLSLSFVHCNTWLFLFFSAARREQLRLWGVKFVYSKTSKRPTGDLDDIAERVSKRKFIHLHHSCIHNCANRPLSVRQREREKEKKRRERNFCVCVSKSMGEGWNKQTQ